MMVARPSLKLGSVRGADQNFQKSANPKTTTEANVSYTLAAPLENWKTGTDGDLSDLLIETAKNGTGEKRDSLNCPQSIRRLSSTFPVINLQRKGTERSVPFSHFIPPAQESLRKTEEKRDRLTCHHFPLKSHPYPAEYRLYETVRRGPFRVRTETPCDPLHQRSQDQKVFSGRRTAELGCSRNPRPRVRHRWRP